MQKKQKIKPVEMSYEKAVRCLPSFLMPLTNGRPTLLVLQAGVIWYGIKELGLNFPGYEEDLRIVDLEFKRAHARDAEQLLRWLEQTGAITRNEGSGIPYQGYKGIRV